MTTALNTIFKSLQKQICLKFIFEILFKNSDETFSSNSALTTSSALFSNCLFSIVEILVDLDVEIGHVTKLRLAFIKFT